MGQKGSRPEPSEGNFDRRAAHRLSKGKMKKDDIQLGAASIHQMEATLPMPSEVEVDEKFSRMVVSVGCSKWSEMLCKECDISAKQYTQEEMRLLNV